MATWPGPTRLGFKKAPHLGIDSEDLGFNILPAIAYSFGIKFAAEDFHEGFPYGELHTLVLARLPQTPAADCSSQQASYKLRQALQLLAGNAEVRPDSPLASILPADPRPAAAAIRAKLGMHIDLVGRPGWAAITGTLAVTLLLVLLFFSWFSWPLALSLLGLAVVGSDSASRWGREVRFGTGRQVVARMSSRYYPQARRHPGTVNPREVKAQLDYLVMDMAGLEAGRLVPQAIL